MTCPVPICHCMVNVCQHRVMQQTPGRKRRGTHATRKFNELQKERAKYRDGCGWSRAIQSKLDAEARSEFLAQRDYKAIKMPSWLAGAYNEAA